ncbi:hypothetical protein ABIB15_001384 [Marisediminicola sp. UYEF4]
MRAFTTRIDGPTLPGAAQDLLTLTYSVIIE